MNIHTIWVADHIALSTSYHTHDYYQLLYCQKTGGTVTIHDKIYECKAGYIYFLHPMEPHSISRGKDMRLTEIKFLARDAFTTEQLLYLPNEFSITEFPSIQLLIKDVVKEGLGLEIYSNESTNAALTLLLIRLLRNFVAQKQENLNSFDYPLSMPSISASKHLNDLHIAKVANYIEENIHRQISLEELSDLIHFNKSYLVEKFKEIIGITPMKYANLKRIEKSKELLSHSNLSITEISYLAGFQSIHYFSRYFKLLEHTTPQAYRKNTKSEYRNDDQI